MNSTFCLCADRKPTNFEESEENTKWQKAKDEEIRARSKNDTWELPTSKTSKDNLSC